MGTILIHTYRICEQLKYKTYVKCMFFNALDVAIGG